MERVTETADCLSVVATQPSAAMDEPQDVSRLLIYQAINHASVALLEVDRLHQRLGDPERHDEDLAHIEATLHKLGDLLRKIRDTPRLSD